MIHMIARVTEQDVYMDTTLKVKVGYKWIDQKYMI